MPLRLLSSNYKNVKMNKNLSNSSKSVCTLSRTYLIIGALLAGFAVILGAFGAHGLKSVLSVQQLGTFEIGVRYQMYHGLALLMLPALANYIEGNWANRVAFCFVVGCVLFSGSLYALAVTSVKWFGPITPLGGTFFIIGWGILAFALATNVSGQSNKQENANKNQGNRNV